MKFSNEESLKSFKKIGIKEISVLLLLLLFSSISFELLIKLLKSLILLFFSMFFSSKGKFFINFSISEIFLILLKKFTKVLKFSFFKFL